MRIAHRSRILTAALVSLIPVTFAACWEDSAATVDVTPGQGIDTNAAPGAQWRPPPGTTWAWQLTEAIDTSVPVAMYDIDLFNTPAQDIAALRASGRVVICYFSAGTFEEGRPDAGRFVPADIGKALPDWPDERWLDVRSSRVRAIMRSRLDVAVQKGCDGVEPDNVDAYVNDSGFRLTEAHQLNYNRFLAAEAHARGLSVGLKNAVDLVEELEPVFDWALNEECLAFDECHSVAPFIAAGKAVFHVEYVDQRADGPARQREVCGDATIAGFSTLIKTWDLDAWYLACP